MLLKKRERNTKRERKCAWETKDIGSLPGRLKQVNYVSHMIPVIYGSVTNKRSQDEKFRYMFKKMPLKILNAHKKMKNIK